MRLTTAEDDRGGESLNTPEEKCCAFVRRICVISHFKIDGDKKTYTYEIHVLPQCSNSVFHPARSTELGKPPLAWLFSRAAADRLEGPGQDACHGGLSLTHGRFPSCLIIRLNFVSVEALQDDP